LYADFEPELDWETQYRITRVQLALDTGWTLEYIDNMSLEDYGDILAFLDGKNKANA